VEHLREFSGSIATIIQGVKDLAEVDPNNKRVVLVENCPKLTYDLDYNLRQSGTAKMIVAYNNPEGLLGCSCSADHIVGERVWGTFSGKHGQLGLQAVIITFNNLLRIVDLIFPFHRNATLPEVGQYHTMLDGYNVVRIEQTGLLHNAYTSLSVRPMDICLRSALGMINKEDLLQFSSGSGGSIEAHLDLPGAYDYLAKHVPTLGGYLSGLAKKITEQTKKQKTN
ncbi:MAG: hypothetical protein HY226_04715, partial [Candidatus Vogelbacteria bacterium]|nr:hypothetical protein [Candidatus Vogelbacteria bacterium]